MTNEQTFSIPVVKFGPKKWTFDIGDRVKVFSHFDPDAQPKHGKIVGQDSSGDQYFDVELNQKNRCGETVIVCEDKQDLKKL